MSKGFAIALVAALVLVPSTTVISTAEESQAETKQGGCDKSKGCCDKKTACDKDCKSTACKCKDCKNADCDAENCKCDGYAEADCQCPATAGAKCDASGCRVSAVNYAGCDDADCATGNCCSESSCEGLTTCGGYGSFASEGQSALRLSGPSLLDIALPPSAAATDELWQLVANELDAIGQPAQCDWRVEQSTPTTPTIADNSRQKSIYLVLDSVRGGDSVIECECKEGTTVRSVLQGAVLPHPVDFGAAEIAVHRACTLVKDGGVVEVKKSVLPVKWDQAAGQPTECTDHALQACDKVCVNIPAAHGTAKAVATAYTQATPAPRSASVERWYQPVEGDENTTQIQYSIQIIEDSHGCMAEYEQLRRGAPMMCAESKTLLPAMRMLNKHQLIRQLSSPKLTCVAGQTAQLQIGSEKPVEDSDEWEGVRLAVASEETENGLMIELAMHASEEKRDYERRMALVVEPGQTIVLNAKAGPAFTDAPKEHEPAVYIVVTPEIVK
jgi:hypothetical protein